MGNLEVVIPPDILNDNESSEGGGVAVEGGIIRLKCHAVGIPDPTVSWRREDSQKLVLRQDGSRDKKVRIYEGDTLILSNVQRTDMGSYFCIASNGVPPTVSKRFIVRVHFHPMIRVQNQLVAAPIAKDVYVQCYVEASPRAMNHWMRDNGEKLIPSDKYDMQEIVLNEYSYMMNLTIRSLEKKDFGGYVCTSSNALGKAEGLVRLQELNISPTIPTTTAAPKLIEQKTRKTQHNKDKSKKYRPIKPIVNNEGKDDFGTTTMRNFDAKTAPSYAVTTTATRRNSWIVVNSSQRGVPKLGVFLVLWVLYSIY